MDWSYAPLLFVIPLAVLIPTIMMVLTTKTGPNNPVAGKMVTYESGILPSSTAEQRYPVRFYLVAVSFLLFDVEALFLFPWAVRFRELGWFGFGAMTIFLLILVLGLAYEWRKGGLEWN